MTEIQHSISLQELLQDDIELLALESVWRHVMEYRLPAGGFVRALDAIHWDEKPATAFYAVIQMCIALDAVELARTFAKRGAALYPLDERLRALLRVLLPPKVLSESVSSHPDQSLSVQWLQDHSHTYAGLWVAVRAGELLDSADTRQALITKLGLPSASPDLLITWIP